MRESRLSSNVKVITYFCFSYSEPAEAEAAVKALDGESVLGKVIQCNIAKFKKHIKKKKETKG